MAVEMFTVGKIVNTHGVRGEVKVIPTTDDPNRFKKLKSIYVSGKDMTTKEIETVRFHKGFVLIKFKDINDMDAAERLKGTELKIDRKDSLPLRKNEYYISDLYGLQVYTVEDNRHLGELVDIIETGSNDVYVVKSSERERDLLLPAIREVIKEVNSEEGKMLVHLLDGLEDL